jgi:hypothetical protein
MEPPAPRLTAAPSPNAASVTPPQPVLTVNLDILYLLTGLLAPKSLVLTVSVTSAPPLPLTPATIVWRTISSAPHTPVAHAALEFLFASTATKMSTL